MSSPIPTTDHAARKSRGLVWLALVIALAAGAAAGVSPLVRAVPWKWEQHLGEVMTQEQAACYGSPAAQALLDRTVARLFPIEDGDDRVSVKVRVVRDARINAYAGLGGNIWVNSGLLREAQSPEELAGVLAHEMGHVKRRHILENALMRLLTTQGLQLIFSDGPSTDAGWSYYFFTMSFSRAQEAEADAQGLARLQKAHIDNGGFRRFFERMEAEGTVPVILSDHPANDARIAMVAEYPNAAAVPIMTPDEWKTLKGYCR